LACTWGSVFLVWTVGRTFAILGELATNRGSAVVNFAEAFFVEKNAVIAIYLLQAKEARPIVVRADDAFFYEPLGDAL